MRAGDVIGPEFLGEIIETGPGVRRHKRGDHVVVCSFIGCGRCWYCTHDLWSLCDNSNTNSGLAQMAWGYETGAVFGYSHMMGGFAGSHAEYVRVPFADYGAFTVPGGVDDISAVFASDAVPTGWMGADLGGVQPGDVVAVWGAGGVGQMAARASVLLGAEEVMVIDRIPERLSFRLGDREPARDHRKQTVAGGQEKCGLVAFGLSERQTHRHLGIASDTASRAPAVAAVTELAAGHTHADVGPEVRQPVAHTGGQDRWQARRVEREEPDPAAVVPVTHVRTDVDFPEPRQPRRGRQSRRSDPLHEERGQPDPGHPVRRLDGEVRRQQPLHHGRLVAPVQERYPVPVVIHHWPRYSRRRRSLHHVLPVCPWAVAANVSAGTATRRRGGSWAIEAEMKPDMRTLTRHPRRLGGPAREREIRLPARHRVNVHPTTVRERPATHAVRPGLSSRQIARPGGTSVDAARHRYRQPAIVPGRQPLLVSPSDEREGARSAATGDMDDNERHNR